MDVSRNKFELLRRELVDWIGQNKLWTDTVLRLIDEYDGDEHGNDACHRYFMIRSEGDLSSIIDGYEIEEPGRGSRLHAEFRALVERHGFWFETETNIITHIYLRD